MVIFAAYWLYRTIQGVAKAGSEGASSDVVQGLGAGLAAFVVIATALAFFCGRPERRALKARTALAGPGGWAGACVLAAKPAARLALLVDDAGIRLIGGGGVVGPWAWETVTGVELGPLPVQLPLKIAYHDGITVHLTGGGCSRFWVPVPVAWGVLLRYPPGRAEAVVGDIGRRLEAAHNQNTALENPVRQPPRGAEEQSRPGRE